ncbi:alginate export family protein [Leptospira sp. GIMC2001]|uniref:alginate export family protein n=1 Tax=Leptospira sp. GIMC2001 TaxID=1513297 RepID=UPI00234A82B2|nr:alginate export family protein [Leptospira sp. GIMC2001]WCL49243.1 alginate export family protein [Leptospira sp. GIMC2001]
MQFSVTKVRFLQNEKVFIVVLLFVNILFPLFAESTEQIKPENTKSEINAGEDNKSKNYYVNPRSYGTKRVPQPDEYVKLGSQTGIPGLEDVDWLEMGLDYRTRYEYRENDFRRNKELIDRPLLLRTRGYVGVKEKFDPFRFALEIEDAQRIQGKFERDTRDFNQIEPIQSFFELYYPDALGKNRPLSIRAGRMAFEFLDRRLLARNAWRNTTNTFQGLRMSLGKEENDWNLDVLALSPLEIIIDKVDKPVRNLYLYGLLGSIQAWSDIITIQPFYIGLVQSRLNEKKYSLTKFNFEETKRVGREIHTTGIRGYGLIGKTGFDYDISAIYQFGINDIEKGQAHLAYAFTFDSGYTFNFSWKPRLGFFYGFASGDRDPYDKVNNRFERLYGFARPWSSNDYFQMENLSNPKIVIEFSPIKDLRIDTAYVWYYLASNTDRWNNARLRDESGQSGIAIGEEYNIRMRYKINNKLNTTIGYAFFKPNEFTLETSGREKDSHFAYIEMSLSAF